MLQATWMMPFIPTSQHTQSQHLLLCTTLDFHKHTSPVYSSNSVEPTNPVKRLTFYVQHLALQRCGFSTEWLHTHGNIWYIADNDCDWHRVLITWMLRLSSSMECVLTSACWFNEPAERHVLLDLRHSSSIWWRAGQQRNQLINSLVHTLKIPTLPCEPGQLETWRAKGKEFSGLGWHWLHLRSQYLVSVLR